MSDDQPNQMRKSTKGLIAGGGLIGSLFIYSQLADRFVTREEGISIVANQVEATRKMERGFDKVIDRIKEAEARLTANQQSAEARANDQRSEMVHRLETLEQAKIVEAGRRSNKSNN